MDSGERQMDEPRTTASAGGLRFDLPRGGRALFTTRAAGNLSTVSGPGHEWGRDVRERVRAELGLGSLCAGRQVHGAVVRRVRGPVPAQGGEADGQATYLPRVGVMVLVADCVPVLLGSEGAVAAIHAGWRGLAGGVLEEGVRALRELSSDGEAITAIIGPAAGGCCYEVGEEVHELFGGAHREGRRIDLRAIASERLTRAGVPNVEQVERCTICDPELFSHRREGARAGRQAGIAWLS
jgi:YfiH family protein